MPWPDIGVQPYFEDESVQIYHADCRDILPLLPKVDLVLTDPPYGVGFEYRGGYDDRDANWVLPVFEIARTKAPLLMITTGMKNLWLYPPADWVMCWAKPGSTRRNGLGGFNEWEPVLVYGKRRIYNDFRYLPDCANHATDSGDHPCPKPLALCRWLVSSGSDEGATILDPFMGSGTTLVAAQSLGRKSIGIEIEEKYCRIAVERLRQKPLPLTEPMSHDRLTVQGGLFDGTSTNRRDKAENIRGEQGQDSDRRGAAEAQRDTQEALPRGQTDNPLEGNQGQGHMESQGEGFSIVEGRQVR